jgi:diguanylate cyclase
MNTRNLQLGHFISNPPSWQQRFGPRYAIALALWLLASITVLGFVLRSSIELKERELNEYAEVINTHIRDKLRANEAVLYGFASFLGAIGENSHDSAKIYANSVLERYPHIHMLEIVRKLPRHELESYSAQLRRTTVPSFQVRQFGFQSDRRWHSPPEKDYYYPIVFMAPELPGSADAYGLDIDCLDSLKRALLRSEHEGIPASSTPFHLIEGDTAYVMFRPVINGFGSSATPAKGIQQSTSYALLVVRARELLPASAALSTKVHHMAQPIGGEGRAPGESPLALFDLAATPGSALESYLLPQLRSEHRIDGVSQPLRLVLERQLHFSDIDAPSMALSGTASLLSFALLLAFLRSRDRQFRSLEESRRAIEHLALHDALTGLPNRFLMLGHLEQALSLALRHDMKVGVLFLDLDGFKPINDRLGHPVGDIVLQEVARRLLSCIRNCDTASRYGGDEFVILLTEIWGEENAALAADKVLAALEQPIQIGPETVLVSASIGIAIFPNDGCDAKGLIDEADKAMYEAKQRGPGQFAFSDADARPETASTKANAPTPALDGQ